MAISEFDKKLIDLVNVQVNILRQSNTPDQGIVDELYDFVSDVKAFVQSADQKTRDFKYEVQFPF